MKKGATAVLLVNLGTPFSAAPSDVKKYLIEFLTDERVVDIPWVQRQVLVRGAIVPRRYKESSKAYQEVWTEQGSPLLIYGERVRDQLQERLGEDYQVELAMRYQQPSLKNVLCTLQQRQLRKIIVIPLFPQYASATTGSIFQKMMELMKQWQTFPTMHWVGHFYENPDFIAAWCEKIRSCSIENYDHILFSFHGLPQRQLIKAGCGSHCQADTQCCQAIGKKNGGCYGAQCYATARLISEQLNLDPARYSVSFQSRLGKEPWIEPFTADRVAAMPGMGIKKVLVVCPSFICDCLETLQEIGIELKQEFLHQGGESLDLVPSLNDSPLWIKTLEKIVADCL